MGGIIHGMGLLLRFCEARSIDTLDVATQSTLLGAHPALEILGLRKHRNVPLLPHASPRWIAHHPSCIALPSTTLVASSSKFAASAPLELFRSNAGPLPFALRKADVLDCAAPGPSFLRIRLFECPVGFGGCIDTVASYFPLSTCPGSSSSARRSTTSNEPLASRFASANTNCVPQTYPCTPSRTSAAALKPELVVHTVCIPAVFEVGITPESASTS
ncbi:hypothetical protein DFH06DRAFT_1350212 [Mycena polygramma]|nr:hypothetical protein DFH06DRAFT_1350212 [Mycena polygramma]